MSGFFSHDKNEKAVDQSIYFERVLTSHENVKQANQELLDIIVTMNMWMIQHKRNNRKERSEKKAEKVKHHEIWWWK